MDDRYLYKAKRKHDSKFAKKGEWVEGAYYIEPYTEKGLIIQWNSTGIGFNEFIEVDKDTVCQCTGLKDKNGKLIWENDIVTGWFDGKRITGYIMYGSNAHFFIERKGLYGIHLDNSQDWLEVIGNIFDNLELLEVGE